MPQVGVNGVELYYEREGDGQPVVFHHGAFSDHQAWGYQEEALADEYEVITYDARGHGRSEGSDHDGYTMDMYAADLHGLITALDLDEPFVVGLSMGGKVALTYAAQYQNLAGVAVSGTTTPEPKSRGEWLFRRVVNPSVIKAVSVVGYDRMMALNEWLAGVFASDSDAVEKAQEELQDHDPEVDAAEFKRIAAATNQYLGSELALEDIDVPALVMYGESEPFTENHVDEYWRIPDVEVTGFPNAGHNTHIERPEAFTEQVRTFLETI